MAGFATTLPNPPSLLKHASRSFLIMDAPTEDKKELYLNEIKKYDVKHIVRACEPMGMYPASMFEDVGVTVHELGFPDGKAPPDEIISKWLDLCQSETKQTIGVHCVAGLGRAPMLVAIFMIESGMEPLEAVAAIREQRRGAFNTSQINYLETYQPSKRKKDCAVM